MKFTLQKAQANPTETPDGELTRRGMDLAHAYAVKWIERNVRDLQAERDYPELAGLFYDIRVDTALAREHAIPFDAPKTKLVVPIK